MSRALLASLIMSSAAAIAVNDGASMVQHRAHARRTVDTANGRESALDKAVSTKGCMQKLTVYSLTVPSVLLAAIVYVWKVKQWERWKEEYEDEDDEDDAEDMPMPPANENLGLGLWSFVGAAVGALVGCVVLAITKNTCNRNSSLLQSGVDADTAGASAAHLVASLRGAEDAGRLLQHRTGIDTAAADLRHVLEPMLAKVPGAISAAERLLAGLARRFSPTDTLQFMKSIKATHFESEGASNDLHKEAAALVQQVQGAADHILPGMTSLMSLDWSHTAVPVAKFNSTLASLMSDVGAAKDLAPEVVGAYMAGAASMLTLASFHGGWGMP